jgi:hypothetical protein
MEELESELSRRTGDSRQTVTRRGEPAGGRSTDNAVSSMHSFAKRTYAFEANGELLGM